jgi:hypothetical protein
MRDVPLASLGTWQEEVVGMDSRRVQTALKTDSGDLLRVLCFY